MKKSVAFILKGYPRLSETFIAQEIRALEQRGLDITIYSLRFPTDKDRHPIHHDILAKVVYLPEYLHQEPLRVLRAWQRQRRRAQYPITRRLWWRDFRRDPSRNRLRRLGQAMVLAAELDEDIVQLHAHFMHTPASVARYAGSLTDLPWSCSAHAKDIWTIPDWEKREKLDSCAWLATCTACNRKHLQTLTERPDKIDLVYHGIDFERFAEPPAKPTHSTKSVRILSVGRAVAKKGYDQLLEALAAIAPSVDWSFTHIGGGVLLKALKKQAIVLGIEQKIAWLGPRSQEYVLQQYRSHDIFALPSRIGQDGDRDGLPNVLIEAQSQKLACVSTTVSAIPELIIDGETGILVAPDRPQDLHAALDKLIADLDLRERLAKAGFERVRRHFSMDRDIDHLYDKFRCG